MKKTFLMLVISALALCFFAMGVSAAETDVFGTPETSTTINLETMAADDDVYCVLFDGTEYHTYPSRYIVTNNATMTWNFNYINEAFGKSYTAESVIRIQVPSHVTTMPCITSAYFSWRNVTTLKEVAFPEDTIVTTFNWGAFEKCSGLESIVIPNTVTTFAGINTFSGCTSLKSVVFEEGSQLTSLPDSAFGSTLSLTEIVLPPSITTIGRSILGGHGGKLSKIVLSPNLSKVTGNALLNALGRGNDEFIEVYMPACFATAEGSVTSGNIIGRGDKSDLKKYVIFFTGTKEQAQAFVTKYSGDISLCDANIVAYDPTKINAQEYLGMDPYTTDITVNTNRVIVFGYGVCDAFYGGNHVMKGEETISVNSYFEAITIGDICTREGCGNMIVTKTLDPIFIDCGYSYTEEAINGSYSMSQFYKIDRAALEAYKAETNATFDFGLLVSTVNDPLSEENKDLISLRKTYIAESKFVAHDYFGIGIKGITTDAQKETALAFCAFVNDNGKIFYLNGGKTESAVTMNSYNDLAK